MSGGQKGFTLIELLVVIAILGVIAAVVALNVGTFFGRGTVQAANTELHQVQTAIISLMADAETGTITLPAGSITITVAGESISAIWWPGGSTFAPLFTKTVDAVTTTYQASDYVYGPFRATYLVDVNGNIHWALCQDAGDLPVGLAAAPAAGNWPTNPWSGIVWSDDNRNWEAGDEAPIVP